eukprot:TRINITY_DN18438_c2_g1_i1.p1 TRINITY_DN18438_c2_g1~~TRINITY_DN18438_c2_g1_i1.p1  ORF type:complete len:159 (-),score=16.89 TRINITY_DN18438_c2_g1_i1:148-564(-)
MAAAALPTRLTKGPAQPFYQVLISWTEGGSFPIAYVADELLCLPDDPNTSAFEHAHLHLLFYGADARGDFIPCRQLQLKHEAEGSGSDSGGVGALEQADGVAVRADERHGVWEPLDALAMDGLEDVLEEGEEEGVDGL